MQEPMPHLLGLCTAIDRAAAGIYRRLADTEPDEKLRACWNQMSEEEDLHVTYWSRLTKMAAEGIVPTLFEQPDLVIEELEAVARDVGTVEATATRLGNVRDRALLALRLELCLLHPAFDTLMQFLSCLEPEAPDRYSEHLDGFLVALCEYTKGSPELELIAKTTRQLWLRNRQLLKAANSDALTGLLNHRGFWTAVAPLAHLARRRGENVAVITLDVDGLKEINDELGHCAGDDVLKSVAGILRSALREADVACRLGGDEFVAFMIGVEPASLEAICQRIQAAVRSCTAAGKPFAVSIGAAHGKLEGDVVAAIEQLRQESDEHMYTAKPRPRSRVAEPSQRPFRAAAPGGNLDS